MEDKNIFPKGTYVVLKQGCVVPNSWGHSIPINNIYVLREDSSNYYFKVELDIQGISSNGWSISSPSHIYNKLVLKKATIKQVIAYEFIGGPCYEDSFKEVSSLIKVKIKRKY